MNDQRLMDLAKYKVTDGMLKDATQTDIIKAFTSMKKRILSGKTTLGKLEETVFGRLGIQEEIEMPEGLAPMGFGHQLPMARPKDDKKIDGFADAKN